MRNKSLFLIKRPKHQNDLNESDRISLRRQIAIYSARLLDCCQLSTDLLEVILSVLEPAAQAKLRALCEASAPEDAIAIDWTGFRLYDDLLRFVTGRKTPEARQDAEVRLRSFLMGMLEQITNEEMAATPILRDLRSWISLTADESALIELLYCRAVWEPLDDILSPLCGSDEFLAMAIMTELPERAIKDLFSSHGRLLESGILVKDRPTDPLQLSAELREYLSGISGATLCGKSYRRIRTASIPLEQFDLSPQAIGILVALVSSPRPSHILLHGRAGTGKTELARSLVCACGKEAIFPQFGEQGENKSRRMILETATGMASNQSSVIVIDESDSFLNTGRMFWPDDSRIDKGWLNDFLDRLKITTIWISNSVACMEESTLRRFAYSLEFTPFTPMQRKRIWHDRLKKHPLRDLVSETTIDRLSANYQVNAAGITSALNAIETICPTEATTSERVESALCEVLERHEALTASPAQQRPMPLDRQYDPSCVHTDVDIGNVLHSINNCLTRPVPCTQARRSPLNLLFWGLPGTGKTEFAKYLAQNLGRTLIVKRASDLLDPYVGGTEKNIRAAFRDIRDNDCVLLLDEADSFLYQRETAIRSWEVTQINEFLTQIENHMGILICCTNLLDRLDYAAMRRFVWKIKFLPLTAAGKRSLYKRMFHAKIPAHLHNRLSRIADLTAGDFKTAWHKWAIAGPAIADHELILGALEEEARYKKGTRTGHIGFM